MRVDLPAPFSPTRAWTVPVRTRSETSRLATTPGKRLVTPVSSTATASGDGAALVGSFAMSVSCVERGPARGSTGSAGR